ncbi:MAG: helix-turn-helix domain-containing protein [Thermomicrobiales bacterium]
MAKHPKHLVVLTPAERARLAGLLRRGTSSALTQRRARILLAADVSEDRPAQTDVAVATATQVDARTVARVRAEFAQHGLERALAGRRPVFPVRRKLSDLQEAQVLVLAQSEPPAGQTRWTLRLLSARLVELAVVETISHETVRATLKKTISSPGGSSRG